MIEREQLVLIVRTPMPEILCEECGRDVKMIEMKEASRLARISQREIFSRMGNDSIHFKETPLGSLFICFDSLVNDLRQSG